jgi:hypothetical protein
MKFYSMPADARNGLDILARDERIREDDPHGLEKFVAAIRSVSGDVKESP